MEDEPTYSETQGEVVSTNRLAVNRLAVNRLAVNRLAVNRLAVNSLEAQALMDTEDLGLPKWRATSVISSALALPSTGGAFSCAA